jgi:hypothetical protein
MALVAHPAEVTGDGRAGKRAARRRHSTVERTTMKHVMRYGWAAVAMVLCIAAAPIQREDGWVTILDAKSFKDWKVAPESPKSRVEETATQKRVIAGDSLHDGRWTFKDGVLHGEGGVSHIFSPRGDYENFSYRAEIKIKDKGNSGQYFRTEFGNGFPNGYEAQVNSTHTDPVRTGSLYGFVKVFDMLVPPDTWFTQEVTAVGNHIVIKVNGKTTVDYVDTKNTHMKGHFAFQQHNLGSEVWIRHVQVKELPKS